MMIDAAGPISQMIDGKTAGAWENLIGIQLGKIDPLLAVVGTIRMIADETENEAATETTRATEMHSAIDLGETPIERPEETIEETVYTEDAVTTGDRRLPSVRVSQKTFGTVHITHHQQLEGLSEEQVLPGMKDVLMDHRRNSRAENTQRRVSHKPVSVTIEDYPLEEKNGQYHLEMKTFHCLEMEFSHVEMKSSHPGMILSLKDLTGLCLVEQMKQLFHMTTDMLLVQAMKTHHLIAESNYLTEKVPTYIEGQLLAQDMTPTAIESLPTETIEMTTHHFQQDRINQTNMKEGPKKMRTTMATTKNYHLLTMIDGSWTRLGMLIPEPTGLIDMRDKIWLKVVEMKRFVEI